MEDEAPQNPAERRIAARRLVQQPLCCAEHDPDTFRLIRRHEADLDKWFTQRLGYRLHVDADTARLFKTGVVPTHRALRTSADRPLHQLEYVLLALILGSTVAGPDVISLRDLVDQVRSAAADAGVTLAGDALERRALVAALKWMIDHGLASELHSHVDGYATHGDADAVLKVRPDRIALLPLPGLAGTTDAESLVQQGERRELGRAWMRARLVEDPVLYRDDLTDAEWAELRRRLGEEERMLHEMFGLTLESRAEGVAAVDPTGSLAEQRFPAGGTVGHAALLLIEALGRGGGADVGRPDDGRGVGPLDDDPAGEPGTSRRGDGSEAHGGVAWPELVEVVGRLAEEHRSHWSKDLVDSPTKLAKRVVQLLVDLRLAERATADDEGGELGMRLLPAAGRFLAVERAPAEPEPTQDSLW